MDFDKPKVYGDTSITDGLVTLFTLLTYIASGAYTVYSVNTVAIV